MPATLPFATPHGPARGVHASSIEDGGKMDATGGAVASRRGGQAARGAKGRTRGQVRAIQSYRSMI